MDRKPDLTLPALTVGRHTFTDARLVHVGHYGDGSPAYEINEPGDPYGAGTRVTVAMPDVVPAEGCIFVKDYSENTGMVAALLSAGIIRTTGRVFDAGYIRSGVVEAEIL